MGSEVDMGDKVEPVVMSEAAAKERRRRFKDCEI